MLRQHGMLAGLVILAAVWAYVAAHPLDVSSSARAGQFSIWKVPLQSVQSLIYRDGDVRTTITAKWDETTGSPDVPSLWIESVAPGRAQGKKSTDDGKADEDDQDSSSAAGTDPSDSQSEAFKGNAAAVEVLRTFSALKADRDLGPLGELDAKQYGLNDTEAYLELTRLEQEPLRLNLGRTAFGQSGRYAHFAGNGRVYLLRSPELRRMGSVRGRLMDRELLAFPIAEATRIELSMAGMSRTFYRLDQPGQWGVAPDAEADSEMAVVAAALERLKVLRYDLERAEVPESPELEVRLYTGEGRSPDGWVRLYPSTGQTALAVSSHTGRPVHVAQPVVRQMLDKAGPLVR